MFLRTFRSRTVCYFHEKHRKSWLKIPYTLDKQSDFYAQCCRDSGASVGALGKNNGATTTGRQTFGRHDIWPTRHLANMTFGRHDI